MNKLEKINIINTIRQAILRCPTPINHIFKDTISSDEKEYLYRTIDPFAKASVADIELMSEREDILIRISSHKRYRGLSFYVDTEKIESKSEDILQHYYNTDRNSCLFYKEGRFYVNRNPYIDEEDIPESGIPVTHQNIVRLTNMSDFHTTAVVLGNDEKVGLFSFEYAYGMQAFRYVSNEDEPFPFDEIRYAEGRDGLGFCTGGYFACRKGEQWSIVRIGDKECSHSRNELLPLAERSFEEALTELAKIDDQASTLKWSNV